MKKIFLFTHSFPFSKVGEAFIDVELQVASTLDAEITIIPLFCSSYQKKIPANIKIIKDLCNMPVTRKSLIFLKMLVNSLFFELVFLKEKKHKKWSHLYHEIKYLYGGFLIKDFLISNKKIFPEGSILYSFWLNYTVLGFALAKDKSQYFKTCKFYSRAHRYDLYAEDVGIFIPYREKMLLCLDKVFSGSTDGVNFLSDKYPDYSSKIDLSRLGVLPTNIEKRKCKNKDVSLLSCSNVIPIKRVCLIFSSVKQFCENNPGLNVSWLHIGDGIEMEQLKYLVKESTPNNLTINLAGSKKHFEIVELLEDNEFDAFINLSLSEGLPVTLMMAISAGVPLIATDAGGNKEIVTEETGCLLPLSFSIEEFEKAVLYCMNNRKLRESALLFFDNNFSAVNNYKDFYQRL